MLILFAGPSSSIAAHSLLVVPPSNIPTFNATLLYNNTSSFMCERERKWLLYLAATCGCLFGCLALTFIYTSVCLCELVRRSKRRRRRRRLIAGRVEPSLTRFQLSSNYQREGSGNRDELVTEVAKITRRCGTDSSAFEINTNPSYSVPDVVPKASGGPVHYYADIDLLTLAKKEEPSESYDRLITSQSTDKGTVQISPPKTLPPHLSLKKPAPKLPPKPMVSSTSMKPPTPQRLSPSTSSELDAQNRLSPLSEDYVNEFDGPSSSCASKSRLSSSPLLSQYTNTSLGVNG